MTTEQQHTISIPGLPEGWRAVAYRRPVFGEYYFYNDDIQQGKTGSGQFLIVEKIKPRRIVLEETDEDANCELPQPMTDGSEVGVMVYAHKIWRAVKEVERSSTTFRERVVNDLKHNKIISEGE